MAKKLTNAVREETEKMLYDYYNEKIIMGLKLELQCLLNRKLRLEDKMSDLKNIPTLSDGVKAISYEKPNIQSSGDGSSSFERELMSFYRDVEKEYVNILRKVECTENKIDDIETKKFKIEYALRFYGEEEKRVIECRFKYKHSMDEISNIIHRCKSNVSKVINKLLDDVADFCIFCSMVS